MSTEHEDDYQFPNPLNSPARSTFVSKLDQDFTEIVEHFSKFDPTAAQLIDQLLDDRDSLVNHALNTFSWCRRRLRFSNPKSMDLDYFETMMMEMLHRSLAGYAIARHALDRLEDIEDSTREIGGG